MINNNTMPVASTQSWNSVTMLDNTSPVLVADRRKTFFDYADTDTDPIAAYDYDMAENGSEAVVPVLDVIVEDFETSYPADESKVFLTLGGAGVVEEGCVEEQVSPSSSSSSSSSPALIPTTALEMVVGEDGGCEVVMDMAQPEVAGFLEVQVPTPTPALLGAHPHPSPSPFTPTSPEAIPPQTPSTPSCYSSCSDDVASTVSDVSTPGLTPVTSGEQFLIPLPADDKMAAATLTALETCSLTPLIKEELKYTIQSRRLAAGKPELVVDNTPPMKPKKIMTAEEKERALKRREQNRVAAQRFRQKQKDTADVLTRKCHKLEGSNTTLRAEIKRLARESQELRQLLTSHLLACPKVKVPR